MESTVESSVDAVTSSGTSGWAWLPEEPNLTLSIEIVDEEGKVCARTTADEYRKDLVSAKKREGWCAFNIAFHPDWNPGLLQIRARDGSRTFPLGTPFDYMPVGRAPQNGGNGLLHRGSVNGYCDGIRGRHIFGWAWRPDNPDETIHVELCIDGIVVASTEASEYRTDLRTAGIGNGRYGWGMRFPKIADQRTVDVLVRERGGEPLLLGEFQYPKRPLAADLDDPEIAAFISAAFGSEAPVSSAVLDVAPHVTNFLVHAFAETGDPALTGLGQDFAQTLEAFVPVLQGLGRVHRIDDPADWRVEILADEARARGEACLLLSFALPHRAPLGLSFPVVPMMNWRFPTLPDRPRDGDPRYDWNFILRQTGRAIASSGHTAGAVRASLGADYPVATIPTPVWDRTSDAASNRPTRFDPTLSIDGFLLDTRDFEIGDVGHIPSRPSNSGPAGLGSFTHLDGTIFVTVARPVDDGKEWLDVLIAFLSALGDRQDATLVVRMTGPDPDDWWWDFHETIARQPAFSCRVLVLQGYLDADGYDGLIAASHWIVSNSSAEGQSLPLQHFMSAGRPAISPAHTAMSDYINTSNALILGASEEYCAMPLDRTNGRNTARYRIKWAALRDAFSSAYHESTADQAGYRARGDAARETMRCYCSDDVVAAKLDAFLGLGLGLGPHVAPASRLLAEAMAA